MTDNTAIIQRLERMRPGRIVLWTLLFLGGIVMITPIVFMASTSFKTGQEIYSLSIIPDQPSLENYIYILNESKFLRWMLNSLWVATFSTVSVLFFDSLVGYTLANGAYATHRVIDAAYVVKLPDNVPSDLAASIMLKGLTVAYLIHDSYAVKPGDTVLFHAAAGGVGLIAGQWLKALGAKTIGTAGGAEKCALAKANGFDHVIDYTNTDFEAEVMRLTNGEGVNVAYDSVGKDTMARTITSTKRRGTIIAFGQSSGPYADFKITDLSKGSYYLSRPTLFHFVGDRSWLDAASVKLFKAVTDGTINVSINQRFALEDVAKAHDALTGRATTGCTILTV